MKKVLNNEWKTAALGDHVDIETGFPFKSQNYTEDSNGIRLLRGDNIVQGKLRWEGVRRWPTRDSNSYQKYSLQQGDVVLAMDRPWIEAGLKYAWITDRDLPCLLVQRVSRLRGINGLLTDFIRYVIGHHSFTDYVKGIWTGVAVPHISESQIRAFKFLLPPIESQKRITKTLGAYDDLIENNTRRIKILEQMAQMLYREWFVNFCFPGHENVKMIESKMGLIPEGWRLGTLSDALVLQRGFDLPKSERVEGDVPVYAATGVNGTHNVAKVKGPGVVTGRSGSLGSVNLILGDYWPLNTTLWVKEFKQSSVAHAYFLLQDLKLEGFNSGAAVPTLNRNDIQGLPTILPQSRILENFDVHAMTWIRLAEALRRKNQNLRTTRDLLLPKLVSGEISVEHFEEEAVAQMA